MNMTEELKGEVSMIATAVTIGLVMVGWMAIWAFVHGASDGCGGNCNQGQDKCDCKKFE
jgi:hypothetical protein